MKKNVFRKYSVNEEFLDEINAVNSFFIGLMASDGNLRKKGNTFSLSQSGVHGKQLLYQIMEWLSYNGKIYEHTTTYKKSYEIVVSSEKLREKLLEHNVIPIKSYEYFYNGKAMLRPFLQGYIEGDGCVGIYDSGTSNYYYISFFGNKKFKESISTLLPVIPKCQEKNNGYYEIKFHGQSGIDFSNWLWENPVYKDSPKYIKYRKYLNYQCLTTRWHHYKNLNSEIVKMIEKGTPLKQIAKDLDIKRRTVYNLKYNIKNGRGTY